MIAGQESQPTCDRTHSVRGPPIDPAAGAVPGGLFPHRVLSSLSRSARPPVVNLPEPRGQHPRRAPSCRGRARRGMQSFIRERKCGTSSTRSCYQEMCLCFDGWAETVSTTRALAPGDATGDSTAPAASSPIPPGVAQRSLTGGERRVQIVPGRGSAGARFVVSDARGLCSASGTGDAMATGMPVALRRGENRDPTGALPGGSRRGRSVSNGGTEVVKMTVGAAGTCMEARLDPNLFETGCFLPEDPASFKGKVAENKSNLRTARGVGIRSAGEGGKNSGGRQGA